MDLFSKTLRFNKPDYEYFADSNSVYINHSGMEYWKSKYDYSVRLDDFLRANLYKVHNVIFINSNGKRHILRGYDPILS